MFEYSDNDSKLIFKIEGYKKEEDRTDEDAWPGCYFKVETPIVSFESTIADIMNTEVEDLREKIKALLNKETLNITYYESADEIFNMVMYPKGRLFGTLYDNNGVLIEKPEIEFSIRIPNQDYLSNTSVKFVLDEYNIVKLCEYLYSL